MARRSNSLMLPTDDEPEDTAPLTLRPASSMALAGAAADHAAAQTIFARHQAKLSANTRRQYRVTLELWATYLKAAGLPEVDADTLASDPTAWAEVTWGLVDGFVQWLLGEGYAIKSINTQLATIRAYCALAHKVGTLDPVQYSRIRLVRGFARKEGRNIDSTRIQEGQESRKGDKKGDWIDLSPEQAEALKDQPGDTPQGRRDALLMCLLLEHGLRCGEVAGLQVEHFNLRRGTFTFYREKVDKIQTHYLEPATKRALRAYLPDIPPQGPLLLGSRKDGSLTGERMPARSITRRVRVLGKELGIPNLSAHDCRHYWTKDALESGTDIKALQEAGGWNSPAMPLHYAKAAEIANEGVRLGEGKGKRKKK
jgi:integrase